MLYKTMLLHYYAHLYTGYYYLAKSDHYKYFPYKLLAI